MRTTTSPTPILALLLILLPACSKPSVDDTAVGNTAADASAILAGVLDDVWQHMLDNDPLVRQLEGLPIERLQDFSFEGAKRDEAFRRDILDRMARIDAGKLNHQESLSLDILKWELETSQEGVEYFWHWNVITPYASPARAYRVVFGGLPVATVEHRERYLDLLEQVPGTVDALHEIVRGQLERGIVVSSEVLPNVFAFLSSFNQPPEESLFYVRDERLAGSDADEATIRAFQERVAAAIDQKINPAWQRLHDFVGGEYQARAPDAVGARRLPDGENYYRYLTRHFTTFDVEPEEVHKIGLEMVAEIEARMDEIQLEVGFEGTREKFREHLRTDPRYFPKSPEEVAERIMSAADAFYARIDEFFLEKPRAPYGVRRLDPSLEGSMTYGYYDPPAAGEPTGYYYFNGSRLDQRSWLNLEGIAYHELVPGHHFHVARQTENEELPDFRRHMYPTAFTEGWGSYASYLGMEANLLTNPFSRYGVYALEVFLATRLVVDPGMNYLDWTLEKAREYMREHTLESETQINTESLRYGADRPGQALAYQMGKRKILDLRRKAKQALGESFDIRKFHEAVLGSGGMPLTVLEKHVDAFIERERQ